MLSPKVAKPKFLKPFIFVMIGVAFLIFLLIGIVLVRAADTSKFRADYIISDSIFTDYNSMSVTDIQNFLNAKNSVCLKNFQTLSLVDQNNDGLGDEPYGKGVNEKVSAAKLIWQAAQLYKISPKVILVTLQKEQGLITTTDCPSWKYNTALGYGCPDSEPCDTSAYGFTRQIDYGVWHFRGFFDDDYPIPTYVPGNNDIAYNPDSACGSKTIKIINRATAALYSYTPYQPNAATLAAAPGQEVNCGAYGNLNFWRYFSDWFGSPTTKYDTADISYKVYYDQETTVEALNSSATVYPGQTIYIKGQMKNAGSVDWDGAKTKIGTTGGRDRISSFKNDSWIGSNRAASINETSTISPTETISFEFSMTAPTKLGSYIERFGLVEEGTAWISSDGIQVNIDVVKPVSPTETYALSNYEYLLVNTKLTSSNALTTLSLSPSKLTLATNFKVAWEKTVSTNNIARLVMQSDGNLVLRSTTNTALWTSGTSGYPGSTLYLGHDGNLVIRNSNDEVIWSSKSSLYPGGAIGPAKSASSWTSIYKGQPLSTADGRYTLILQSDGNLVLRSGTKAIWATYTIRSDVSKLDIQSDGNLVLRSIADKVVWKSDTRSSEGAGLFMQSDGNLVLRSPSGRTLWNTQTMNR